MDVIIIKGTPGSGKSETAVALSKFFPKGVRMEVDIIRAMVISADWLNQNEHINMLKIAAEMVCGFLKLDFKPVIVVDTFGKDKINPFLKELYRIKNDLSIKIFGLYVTDEELKRRLELRPNDMFKDFPISKELNDEIMNIKNENEILFDTTHQTAEETAQKIYNVINS
jgi:broad-specificity NMP kinase